MTDMSLGAEEANPGKSPKYLLRKIHEENTINWIGSRVELINWEKYEEELEEALGFEVTDVVVEKDRVLKEEEERLARIQGHFSQEMPGNSIDRVLKDQKNMNQSSKEKIVLNELSYLKAKTIDIEPRSVENEEMWQSREL